MGVEQGRRSREIIVGQDDGVRWVKADRFRDRRRSILRAELGWPRPHRPSDVVVAPVITAFEFSDERASLEAPRQTDSEHYGFASGVHEAHELGRLDPPQNLFCEFRFGGARRKEGRPSRNLTAGGVTDDGMTVPKRKGRRVEPEIDQFVTIRVR